jgi:hypothetical protein
MRIVAGLVSVCMALSSVAARYGPGLVECHTIDASRW